MSKEPAERPEHAATHYSATRAQWWISAILWVLWTGAVGITAYLNARADQVAVRPINILGLIIHSTVVGLIGLVVITMIELWLIPWQFEDDDQP